MQLEADGHHIPELEKKPELYNDLVMDYQAFAVLSSSRRMGMSIAPIPISEILAYANYCYITDYEQRDVFLRRIKLLDRVFLEWHQKKANADKG